MFCDVCKIIGHSNRRWKSVGIEETRNRESIVLKEGEYERQSTSEAFAEKEDISKISTEQTIRIKKKLIC